MAQITVDIKEPADRLIAIQLIESLDEAGRIADEVDTVAERLGCPAGKVESVLSQLQLMDPPGIFARSLVECWTIQLRPFQTVSRRYR